MEGRRLEVVERVASGMGTGESSQKQVEHRNIIYKIIDSMLTKNKFKEFFNKNIAALYNW